MRFNDQTILCSNLQCQQFRYISSPNGGNSSENQEIFNFGEEPEYLQKKIKIISHFSKSHISRYHLNDTKIDLKENLVHILSYKISNTFLLFELSNSTFQAKFKDGSNIIIDHLAVHFIKNNKRHSFKSSTI